MSGNPIVDWDGAWDGDRPAGWSSRAVFMEHSGPSPATWDERFPPLSPEREREVLERAHRQHAELLKRQADARKPKAANTYLIGAEGSPLVKIGFTSGRPKARMSSLQTGVPMKLSLLWSTEGDYEGDLHGRFNEYRVIGEWFDLTPLGDAVEVVKEAVEQLRAELSEVQP